MVFEARYLVSTHVWGRGQKYNTSTNLVLLVGAYWATSWLPNIGQVSYCCTSPSNTPKIQRNPHSSTDNPSCILKHFLTTMFTQSKMDGCTCLHMQRDIYIYNIHIYTPISSYNICVSLYVCMHVCRNGFQHIPATRSLTHVAFPYPAWRALDAIATLLLPWGILGSSWDLFLWEFCWLSLIL